MSGPKSPPKSPPSDDQQDKTAQDKTARDKSRGTWRGAGPTGLTKVMTRAALAEYFWMPLSNAAAQLGVSCTTMKRISRKHGVTVWPYRRICRLVSRAHEIEEALAREPPLEAVVLPLVAHVGERSSARRVHLTEELAIVTRELDALRTPQGPVVPARPERKPRAFAPTAASGSYGGSIAAAAAALAAAAAAASQPASGGNIKASSASRGGGSRVGSREAGDGGGSSSSSSSSGDRDGNAGSGGGAGGDASMSNGSVAAAKVAMAVRRSTWAAAVGHGFPPGQAFTMAEQAASAAGEALTAMAAGRGLPLAPSSAPAGASVLGASAAGHALSGGGLMMPVSPQNWLQHPYQQQQQQQQQQRQQQEPGELSSSTGIAAAAAAADLSLAPMAEGRSVGSPPWQTAQPQQLQQGQGQGGRSRLPGLGGDAAAAAPAAAAVAANHSGFDLLRQVSELETQNGGGSDTREMTALKVLLEWSTQKDEPDGPEDNNSGGSSSISDAGALASAASLAAAALDANRAIADRGEAREGRA